MRELLLILICCHLLTMCKSDEAVPDYSGDKDQITATNLLSPKEAYSKINNAISAPIIIQVSKKAAYEEKHLPAALNIWRPDYAADEKKPISGLAPSRHKLEGLLQKLGYEKGKTLFLYDSKANVDALRFAWVLQLYGFTDFKVINGGLINWMKEGLPTTNKKTESPQRTNYMLPSLLNEKIIATMAEVKASIKNNEVLLVDTREPYEYKAEPYIHNGKILSHKAGAAVRGSIPGAVHLNWSTLADLNGDHRIKSEKDLRHDLEAKGITPDKEIILYCHSGSRTSHTFYVLKDILGYKNVKNYDGSWIEWSHAYNQDTTLPINQLSTHAQYNYLKDSLTTSLAHHE